MPKNIASRRSMTKVKGRLQTIEPHSPFQVLVNTKRLERGFSWRALAAAASQHGPKLTHQVLFFWIHNLNGYPSPRSFKADHAAGLAKSLGIEVDVLKASLNESRAIYGEPELTPGPVMDAFQAFIETIENDKRVKLPRIGVLNRAKAFYNGAKARVDSPPPGSK